MSTTPRLSFTMRPSLSPPKRTPPVYPSSSSSMPSLESIEIALEEARKSGNTDMVALLTTLAWTNRHLIRSLSPEKKMRRGMTTMVKGGETPTRKFGDEFLKRGGLVDASAASTTTTTGVFQADDEREEDDKISVPRSVLRDTDTWLKLASHLDSKRTDEERGRLVACYFRILLRGELRLCQMLSKETEETPLEVFPERVRRAFLSQRRVERERLLDGFLSNASTAGEADNDLVKAIQSLSSPCVPLVVSAFKIESESLIRESLFYHAFTGMSPEDRSIWLSAGDAQRAKCISACLQGEDKREWMERVAKEELDEVIKGFPSFSHPGSLPSPESLLETVAVILLSSRRPSSPIPIPPSEEPPSDEEEEDAIIVVPPPAATEAAEEKTSSPENTSDGGDVALSLMTELENRMKRILASASLPFDVVRADDGRDDGDGDDDDDEDLKETKRIVGLITRACENAKPHMAL